MRLGWGLLLLTMVFGCKKDPTWPPPVDMTDTSYFGQRDSMWRANANGDDVALQDFEGKFIWVDYAAPWCRACKAQVGHTKVVSGRSDDVVFLTVMTSGSGGYGHPATVDTARRWAQQNRLEPGRVLAADLTSMTVPKHILFSPEGHKLLEHTGAIRATDMNRGLQKIVRDYNRWKTDGSTASWMHF